MAERIPANVIDLRPNKSANDPAKGAITPVAICCVHVNQKRRFEALKEDETRGKMGANRSGWIWEPTKDMPKPTRTMIRRVFLSWK
jgi:hypothetical protein